MTREKKLIFFAYQGRFNGQADENVRAISHAIGEYNRYQKTFFARSWEDYKKTSVINKEILEQIDACEVFVADVTYFNHNVLFELGYAIAKDKAVLILLNDQIQKAKDRYVTSFLKAFKFFTFENGEDIRKYLHGGAYQRVLSFFIKAGEIKKFSNDIFYMQSRSRNQYSLDLTDTINEFVKEKNNSMIPSDPVEVPYQPLDWFFKNIYQSRYSVIHLLNQKNVKADEENAKGSFWAGLALGFSQKVLLVAPAGFKAPLDYYDLMINYEESEDLVSATIEWLHRNVKNEIQAKPVEKNNQASINLLKLGIGCEVAEYEKEEDLLEYFVDTDAYNVAMNQLRCVLVGRKGSGKTAIHIKMVNELSKKKENYLINLKPESQELLEDVHLASLYDSPIAKRSFFTSVWKFVIFSGLLKNIYGKIVDGRTASDFSRAEENLTKFYADNEKFLRLNVFGVVREIYKQQKDLDGNSPKILEVLYEKFLSPLIRLVKEYFASINLTYCQLIILADNLDQTWDSKNDLDVQSDMILSLLEIENKIKGYLSDKRNEGIRVKQILFLRKDIFDFIKGQVLESDKLITAAHEIDWENHTGLLKKVIENRFIHSLNLEKSADVEWVWKDYFNFGKEHPFTVIEEMVTRRPRDMIYFVSKLFGSAFNGNRTKVEVSDVKAAIDSYSKFLNENLIAETKAEFPEIETILIKLQEHHGEKLEYSKLSKILRDVGYSTIRRKTLVKTLFDKGYMLGFDNVANAPFSDLRTLEEKLNEKNFFIFPKKVFVIAHAKYYFLKNRRSRPF